MRISSNTVKSQEISLLVLTIAVHVIAKHQTAFLPTDHVARQDGHAVLRYGLVVLLLSSLAILQIAIVHLVLHQEKIQADAVDLLEDLDLRDIWIVTDTDHLFVRLVEVAEKIPNLLRWTVDQIQLT